MRKYTSLLELQADHRLLFDRFEADLQSFFTQRSSTLKRMYQSAASSSNHNSFEVILFYIADLSTLGVQTFCKDMADDPEYWNFRGDILPTTLPNPIDSYAKKVESILTPDFEDWLALNDDAYPMSGDEHPVFLKEWPVYLAERVAAWFAENYAVDLYPWKSCYLDFFADSAFHQGEVYDVISGGWVRLPKKR